MDLFICRPEHDKEYDKADKDDNSDDGADKPESNTGHVLAGALSVLNRPGEYFIIMMGGHLENLLYHGCLIGCILQNNVVVVVDAEMFSPVKNLMQD